MNMLMERGNADNYPSVHAFNTFFYPKIMSNGHAGVKRWTKRGNIDIFSKSYILVPVHMGVHWCLAVSFGSKVGVEGIKGVGRNEVKQFIKRHNSDIGPILKRLYTSALIVLISYVLSDFRKALSPRFRFCLRSIQ